MSNEIREVKSLRWLAYNFPKIETPSDEADRMSSCINVYCTAAADLIEQLYSQIARLEKDLSTLTGDNFAVSCEMTKLLKANESAKFEGAKSFADKLLALTEKQRVSHRKTGNKNHPAGSPLREFWLGRETEAEATANRIKDLLKETKETRIYGD